MGQRTLDSFGRLRGHIAKYIQSGNKMTGLPTDWGGIGWRWKAFNDDGGSSVVKQGISRCVLLCVDVGISQQTNAARSHTSFGLVPIGFMRGLGGYFV